MFKICIYINFMQKLKGFCGYLITLKKKIKLEWESHSNGRRKNLGGYLIMIIIIQF